MFTELLNNVNIDIGRGTAQAIGAIVLCLAVVGLCRRFGVHVEREGVVSIARGLGQMVFVLPLGLTLLSALAFVRRVRPGLQIPRGRLVGLGLITIAMLPADHLLGQSTGLLGDWFTRLLVNAFGGPFTVGLSLALVTLGTALAFNFTPPRPPIAAR